MPLDMAAVQDGALALEPAPSARRRRISLDPGLPVGAALRSVREALGLSLEEIAETTRVRAAHLAALESSALDLLPSRPFTIGYVRAYAKALDLDADATAARFRAEFPGPDDDLRSPVGVASEKSGPGRLMIGVLAVMVAGVVAWNVAQHVGANGARGTTHLARAAVAPPRAPAATSGPFQAAAPLPAPPEATSPEPYLTPGLVNQAEPGAAGAAANSVAPVSAPAATAAAAQAPPARFAPAGTVYGPSVGASGLIIQAHKAISLEIRGKGGIVYFARELAAGEAYRVPNLPDLTAEVSNPANAELFQDGVSRGAFPAAPAPFNLSSETGGAGSLPVSSGSP